MNLYRPILLAWVLLFLLTGIAYSQTQKQSNIWYFGNYAGLNFNNNPPTPLLDGQLESFESAASIADTNGNLLFYSNAERVWNKQHQVMPNGTGLKGNNSSSQGALIVRKPGSFTQYYLFQTDAWENMNNTNGLTYSRIDMTLNGGLGDVAFTEKNLQLFTPVTEKMTAVLHANGRDVWLIVHGFYSGQFIAYLITPAGVAPVPVVSNVDPYIGNCGSLRGCMKVSPSGNKLAMALGSANNNSENRCISTSTEGDLFYLYDFDNASGTISNPRLIYQGSGSEFLYGVEFSPDSKKLYLSSVNRRLVYQFDVTTNDISTIESSSVIIGNTTGPGGSLQLAPDGQIYVAQDNQPYLSTITIPNNLQGNVGYSANSVFLNGRTSRRVLPAFVQSSLVQLSPDFSTVNTCSGNPTLFIGTATSPPSSWRWDFGDPASGNANKSTLQSPTHTYAAPGSYKVKLYVSVTGTQDSIIKIVNIKSAPAIPKSSPIDMCSGQIVDIGQDVITPLYTFNWLTTTGIFNPNSPSTQLTLTNTTTSPISYNYILQITDIGTGCKGYDTTKVTVKPIPAVSVSSGVDTLCNSATSVTLTGTPSGGVWTGTGITTAGVINPSALGLGSFSFKYTVTQNGCPNTVIKQVFIKAGPAVSIIGVPDSLCSNAPGIGLNATIAGGTWSGPGVSITGVFTPILAGVGVHTITYQVTQNKCLATASKIIKVNGRPTINAGSALSVCSNAAPITLSATPTGGTWSGSGVSAAGVFTPSVALVGSRTLTYSVTQNGCSGSASIVVTVLSAPVVNAGSNQSVCSNAPAITLSGFSPSGGTWSGNGVSGSGVFTPSTSLVGTQTLTYSVIQNGCTVTATKTVTVLSAPVVNAGNDESVCSNAPTFTLSGFSPAGGTWSGNGVSASGVFTPSTSLVGPQTLTYSVTQNGCTVTATKSITVLSAPVVNAGNDESVCSNAPAITLSGFSPAGGTWSGNGVSAAGVFTPSTSLVGTQTLTYSVTQNGCTVTATKSITVLSAPVVNAGNDESVCSNAPAITLSGFSPAGGTWSGNGVSGSGVFTPSTSLVGAQTLTYSATQNGCTVTATKTVTVLSAPVVNAGNDESVCSNAPTFTLSGFSPAGGTWSGNGVSGSGVFTPSTSLVGTQTLTYSVTQNGCTVTADKTVTVLAAPVVNAGTNESVCSNAPAITLSGFSPAGGIWSGNGVSASGVFTPSTSLVGLQTLTYSVTQNGCTVTADKTVTVQAAPIASTGGDKTFCSGATVQLGGAPQIGFAYSWSPAAGLSSATAANPTLTLTNASNVPQTTIYTLTVTALASGCTDTASLTAIVNPLPVAIAGKDITVCSGTLLDLGTSAETAMTYAWLPKTNLSNGAVANPVFAYTNNTSNNQSFDYTLTVRNVASSCQSTAVVRVTVKPNVIVNAGPDVAFCSGSSDSLGTLALTGYNYSWLPVAGLSDPNAPKTRITHINTNSIKNDTLYYSLTARANGCEKTDTVRAVVYPTPVAKIQGTNSVCPGITDISYIAIDTLNNAYTWSVVGGTLAKGQGTDSITVDWGVQRRLDAALKVVPVSIYGCTGDTARLPIKIQVKLEPETPRGDTVVCYAARFNKTYSVNKAEGSQYIWHIKGGKILAGQTTNRITVSWDTVGIGTLYYVEQTTADTICAGTSDVLSIRIAPMPDSTLAITGDAIPCENEKAVTYNLAGFAGSSYVWSVTGGAILSGQGSANIVVDWAAAGDYIVKATETSREGCTGKTISQAIRINPFVKASGSGTICLGDSIVVAATPGFATYSWSPVAGLQRATAANTKASPALSQTYTVTATDSNGCVSSDTVRVNVNVLPFAFAGRDTAVCSNQPVALGILPNSLYSYKWSIAVGLNSDTLANPIFTLAQTGRDTLMRKLAVRVTDRLTACVQTDSVHLKIFPLPVADAGHDTGVCSNLPVTLGMGSNPFYAYKWSPASGLSHDTLANPVFSLMNNGRDTLRNTIGLTVTDRLTGCTQTDTVRVKVYPLPIANAGRDTGVCSNQPVTLGVAANPLYAYKWLPVANLSKDSLSNPVFNLVNNGRDTLRNTFGLTVTDRLTGCLQTDSVKVKVYPLPIANAGRDTGVCSNQPVTLGIAANPLYAYKWLPVANLSKDSLSNPVFNLVNNGRDTLRNTFGLTVTDRLTGCAQTDSVKIKVYPLPIALAGKDTAACSGQAIALGILPNNLYSYQWSDSTYLNKGKIANPIFMRLNSGRDTLRTKLTLIVLDKHTGCAQTDSIQIKTYPLPVAIAGRDTAICSGLPLTLGITANPLYSYNWQPKDSLSNSAIANPVFRFMHNGRDTLSRLYRLTVADKQTTCAQTDSIRIKFYPLPLALPGSDVTVCSGDTFNLGTPALAGHNYNWLDPSGTLLVTDKAQVRGVSNNSGTTVLNLTFTLSVTENRTGCNQTATVKAAVMPVPVTIFAPTASSLTVCPETTGSFLYRAVGLQGSRYEWQIQGGSTVGQLTDADSVRVIWDLTPGITRSIAVRQKTKENCVAPLVTQTINLDLLQPELISVSAIPDNSTQLAVKWKLNGAPISGKPVALQRRPLSSTTWETIASMAAGVDAYTDTPPSMTTVYVYRVQAENACGTAVESITHQNILFPQAVANQGNLTAQLAWNAYKGWGQGVLEHRLYRKLDDGSFELYQAGINDTTLLYTNGAAGFRHCFRVEAIEKGGNGATAYTSDICLDFAHPITPFNALTPNGDTYNETWKIENLSYYPQNKVEIYNRWGKKVYEEANYKGEWKADGLPAGTYFYQFTVDATPYTPQQTFKGWIQVIR